MGQKLTSVSHGQKIPVGVVTARQRITSTVETEKSAMRISVNQPMRITSTTNMEIVTSVSSPPTQPPFLSVSSITPPIIPPLLPQSQHLLAPSLVLPQNPHQLL